MKSLVTILAIVLPLVVCAQSDKFRPGYIVDKSGVKYEGYIRLEPGNEKTPGTITFREGKNGKKEVYGTSYIKTFKVEQDSFVVLKQIPMPKKKIRDADFARVVLSGPGGTVYEFEYDVEKSSGHAASEFKTIEETSKYYIQIKGKIAMLTGANFKDVSVIVSDCVDLKNRIAAKKIKLADMEKVVDEYQICRSKQSASNQ